MIIVSYVPRVHMDIYDEVALTVVGEIEDSGKTERNEQRPQRQLSSALFVLGLVN